MTNFKNLHCINCGSDHLRRFMDLGNQPNGNHFTDETSKDNEPVFPFAMTVCADCWQVQLEEFPSPEFMFANHPYVTGVNKPIVEHFEKLAARIVERFALPPNSLVIDIGCNDGTLLDAFRRRDMRVLGVDPCKTTGRLCRAKGINVCETFWDRNAGRAMKGLNLSPDLITATAVFYHIPDLHSFVEGLREVMTDRTVFMTQCIYLKDVIEKNQFDHFYHEHTMIHSLRPLRSLFERHGMKMIDVEFDPVHGGSFILYVGLNSSMHQATKRVDDALLEEDQAGMSRFETFDLFSKRVQANRDDLVRLLKNLKAEGKKVYGLCAPVKGSTLLNYAGIGTDLVSLITEVNEFKIGKLTPGTHIPIVSEDSLDEQPDYYLVLSWNFLDYFIKKYASFLCSGGKFISPNPEVRVLGAEALGGDQS